LRYYKKFSQCLFMRDRRTLLNRFQITGVFACFIPSRWDGFNPWYCFEVCNTRGSPKSSFLFRRYLTYTALCADIFNDINYNFIYLEVWSIAKLYQCEKEHVLNNNWTASLLHMLFPYFLSFFSQRFLSKSKIKNVACLAVETLLICIMG
jgi:hypothetical protein